jgi:hypothetical protein
MLGVEKGPGRPRGLEISKPSPREEMLKRILVLLSALATISLAAAVGSRAATIENTSVPLVNFPVFVPCANGGAGEVVLLNGDLHVLITFTTNGKKVSGTEILQPQGVFGIGSVTGAEYQGTGVTLVQFTASGQNGQFETTVVNNFLIIGQGSGNNLLVHSRLHLTFNANGTLIADIANATADCK